MMDDAPDVPRVRWMNRDAAYQTLGRRPTDADLDPHNPHRLRSRISRYGHREFVSEDVEALAQHERAARGTGFETPEQAAERERIFAAWARDAERRRERMEHAHRGTCSRCGGSGREPRP